MVGGDGFRGCWWVQVLVYYFGWEDVGELGLGVNFFEVGVVFEEKGRGEGGMNLFEMFE